jgi:OmpA-OmpF porin, OOP family
MQLTTEFHRVNAHGVTQSFKYSVRLRVAFNSVLLRGKKSSTKAFLICCAFWISFSTYAQRDVRKHFSFSDTSFVVGQVKIITVGNAFTRYEDPDAQLKVWDTIAEFLKSNPKIFIEIGSHTDALGNDDYNLKLSEARAKARYDYLVKQQVDTSQISFKGYGETQPLYPNEIDGNDNPEGRLKNRRTELVIMKIKDQD